VIVIEQKNSWASKINVRGVHLHMSKKLTEKEKEICQTHQMPESMLLELKNLGGSSIKSSSYPVSDRPKATVHAFLEENQSDTHDNMADIEGIQHLLADQSSRTRQVMQVAYSGDSHINFAREVIKRLPAEWHAFYREQSKSERRQGRQIMILIESIDQYEFLKLSGTAQSAMRDGTQRVIEAAKRWSKEYGAVLVGASRQHCDFVFSRDSLKNPRRLAKEILDLCPQLSYFGESVTSILRDWNTTAFSSSCGKLSSRLHEKGPSRRSWGQYH
jgi:hypothetical protein